MLTLTPSPQTLGPNYTGEPTTAIDDFKSDASRTTNAAVAEGKHDVAEAKAASAGYVEQAKALASSALETAQVCYLVTFRMVSCVLTLSVQAYLPTSIGGVSAQADKATTRASQEGQGILASVEATAENVYHAVSEAVQPHLEHAREVAQPRVEQAKDTAQKYLNAAGVPGVGPTSNLKPASEHIIPTSTAPLESGPHTVETPYPPYSSAVKGTDVAAETRPTTLN